MGRAGRALRTYRAYSGEDAHHAGEARCPEDGAVGALVLQGDRERPQRLRHPPRVVLHVPAVTTRQRRVISLWEGSGTLR